MANAITLLLIIVAIIHLLPVSGVFGGERLSALYGIAIEETNLIILMKHRAILFGILGLFIIYAAFKPAFQPLAFIAGSISVISFIFIAWSAGSYNAAINRVVMADLVALVCLVAAVILYLKK